MAAHHIIAFVMAGGEGTRLRPFTLEQPKPALQVGGGWRIVDFVLSNLYNSQIRQVFVLLQYKPDVLIAHLRRQWDISSLHPGEFIEPVVPGTGTTGYAFKGTAHAVYECLDLLEGHQPDLVAVFAADHVYRMDVRQMAALHAAKQADATVATLPMALSRAQEFGVVRTDHDARIVEFQEKPTEPRPMPDDPHRALVSMGNYLFKPDVLYSALHATVARGEHDFGRHVLPRLTKSHRVYAYDFTHNVVPGVSPNEEPHYWCDVGTVEAYVAAHRDMAGPLPRFGTATSAWPMDWRLAPQEHEAPRPWRQVRPIA